MKIEPFDFSRSVNKIELYQLLCCYHNETDIKYVHTATKDREKRKIQRCVEI